MFAPRVVSQLLNNNYSIIEAMAKPQKGFYANASILRRIAALLLDILIVNIIILLPVEVIMGAKIQADSFGVDTLLVNPQQSTLYSVLLLMTTLITLTYFMVMERLFAQTFGKMVLKLKVMSQTKDLKWWQVFVRSMFLIPILPFALLWIIDPIVMLFSQNNQRLSERWSKTAVMQFYTVKKS